MRALLLAIALFIATSVKAGIVTMTFTASGFSTGAPVDPISGTFTWSAASQAAPIDQLLSVDLSIGGHVYTLAEIGFGSSLIGGLGSGVNSVNAASNAHDFLLGFDAAAETLDFMFYAVPGITTQIWFNSESSLDIRFLAVPEPGSLALAVLALLAATGMGRRALRPGRR